MEAARNARRARLRSFSLAALALLCALGTPSRATSPESSPSTAAPLEIDWQVHEGGQVRALVTNWGQVGSMPGSSGVFANEPSAQWPGRSGIEYLWVGGWWIGATRLGEPHVTTGTYSREFDPGSDSDNHIYETRAGAPSGSRAPSPDADDDEDGRVDEDWLDGRDNDSDGVFDEDFAAVSDQMLACAFNDTDPSIVVRYPEHVPLGLLVRQHALAWSRPELDDFVGFDVWLWNEGAESLSDVYVGFFADCDIGPLNREQFSEDDRAGFWEGTVAATLEDIQRDVDISVGTMFDADSDGGTTPGNIGFVFLGAEGGGAPAPELRLRNFRMFSGAAPYASGGDPTTDAERYACLNGTSPASLPPPGTTPRSPVQSGFDDDYRILVSVGPFPALAPGESLHLAMAMVLGASRDEMVQNAARAKILYDGVSADCDGNPSTPEECVVHWTTPRTVPVLVSEIEALWTPAGARLSWRLAEEARHTLRGLYVQRAASEFGPFMRRPPGLMEPTTTHFDDSDLPPTAWYRLELEQLDGTPLLTRAIALDGEASAAFSLDVEALETARVRVRYSLARSTEARLSVHDVSGRLLASLQSGSLPAGAYSEEWNGTTNAGRRVPRGVYVVRLEAGGRVLARKLLLPARLAP